LSFQNSSTQWVENAIADNTTYNGQKNKHLSPVILKPIADKSLNSGKRTTYSTKEKRKNQSNPYKN